MKFSSIFDCFSRITLLRSSFAFVLIFYSSNRCCFAMQGVFYSFASNIPPISGNKWKQLGEGQNPFRNNGSGITGTKNVFEMSTRAKQFRPISFALSKPIPTVALHPNPTQNAITKNKNDEEIEKEEKLNPISVDDEKVKQLLHGFFGIEFGQSKSGQFSPTTMAAGLNIQSLHQELLLISLKLSHLSKSLDEMQKLMNYDETFLKKLGTLCGVAYCQAETEWLRERKMKNLIHEYVNLVELIQIYLDILRVMGPNENDWRFFDYFEGECDRHNNNCAFYVLKSIKKKQLMVIFRGSNGNKQLAVQGWDSLSQQNGSPFDPELKNDPKRVNSYFLKAHKTLWKRVSSLLQFSSHKDYHVTFSGHSLGGALATLAAIQSVHSGILPTQNVELFTFGQPRVGNYHFAKYIDEKLPNSIRVTYGQDPVPHLPPSDHELVTFLSPNHILNCDGRCQLGSKSYHHGIEVWYENGMENVPKIIFDSDRQDNANSWDRWKNWTKSLGDLFSNVASTYQHHQAYIPWENCLKK